MFDTKNVPKDIRKLVDEETLGISLGERRGIDILFGNVPKTGVVIDPKKEAIRIKKNKLLNKTINANPSPAVPAAPVGPPVPEPLPPPQPPVAGGLLLEPPPPPPTVLTVAFPEIVVAVPALPIL